MAVPNGKPTNRRILRQSTFIVPATGERAKRFYSLRDVARRDDRRPADESTPLLADGTRSSSSAANFANNALPYIRRRANDAWQFMKSSTGQGILKCSIAYLLGSLATFIPAIANLIGRGDSKHMVATVTVYFHPARTIGSMHEGAVLAFIGFCYAAFISVTSMAVSVFFADRGLLEVGHLMILIVFCGAGLGFVAWTKQYFGHPLVNVACSLASLGCISTLVRDLSIQAGTFSGTRVVQILFMVLTGILVSTLVNLLILPVQARSKLHVGIAKSTDLQGEILINITRAFLVGEESILQEGRQLARDNDSCLNAMNKDLVEAQREYYVIGRERQWAIEAKLVKCLTRLSHNLGGLRSAASTQFSILGSQGGPNVEAPRARPASSPDPSDVVHRMQSPRRPAVSRPSMLDVINEDPRELGTPPKPVGHSLEDSNGDTLTPMAQTDTVPLASPVSLASQRTNSFLTESETLSPADMFAAFITQLGPPASSLAYTLKQILDDGPFLGHGTVNVNDRFHSSLQRAIELYTDSRREALKSLYLNRALNAQKSADALADLEEVAASCGHFSFSLLDFAEDALLYLESLEDLRQEMERTPRRRTWMWLLFWRKREDDKPDEIPPVWRGPEETGEMPADAQNPVRKADDFADTERSKQDRPWTYGLYKAFRLIRRDDVRFAIKVGVGAALYALLAFLPDTRDVFQDFRGEWGLVSYMVVCSMTIGASNTTGLERFLGTLVGACLAVLSWLISNSRRNGVANPVLLAFLGWLVSLLCFYIMLAKGKGPMARFIILTYNLGALYAYSLSVQDDDNDDDEGGIDPAIWEIVFHRVVSVMVGCVWAIFITRIIWPISARRKLKHGMCVLWLRMSLIWRRDPLAMFLLGEPKSSYMDIREEAELQNFLSHLDSLRQAAKSEFELRGPFPDKIMGRIIEKTRLMLEAFHAMNVVISKQTQCTPGEAAVLLHTRPERFALSARISHLFSVLASSLKLEYPLNDVLPKIEDRRDTLLAKLFAFRRTDEVATEIDYELLYAYLLVTGQLARDIESVAYEIELLFGTLDEESLKLQ